MRIEMVSAELHIFAGDVDWERPIRLRLRFDDGTALRLGVAGDGEGLVVDRLPLEPAMDLGECGRIETFDVTDRLQPALRGRESGPPAAIRGPGGKLVGLALPFPGEETFCLWVHGDNLRWGTQSALANDDWPDGGAPALAGDEPS